MFKKKSVIKVTFDPYHNLPQMKAKNCTTDQIFDAGLFMQGHARIDRKNSQYLYNDGDLYYFMDPETYDQVMINKEIIGDNMKFVKENEEVKVVSYNGSVFAIEPPLFVELEVTETEPGFAGNTAQGATKPATVETGATIQVPLFVNIGDKVKIDTRTSEYLSRA